MLNTSLLIDHLGGGRKQKGALEWTVLLRKSFFVIFAVEKLRKIFAKKLKFVENITVSEQLIRQDK